MSALDIIRANMRPMLSSEEDELVVVMEMYAAAQTAQLSQSIIANLENKYKKAIQSDANDQWRMGFTSAESVIIDTMLTRLGYDPKKLETNAVNLINKLLNQATGQNG